MDTMCILNYSSHMHANDDTGLTYIREALDVIREIDIFYAVGLGKLQSNEPVSYKLVFTKHTHVYHSIYTCTNTNIQAT